MDARRALNSVRLAAVMLLLLSAAFTAPPPAGAAPAAPEAAGAIVRGNTNYEAGDYEQARQDYERAIALGLDNGHVYYNLGNAFYRLGHLGSAIASYRRALRRLPNEPDILANLALARQQAVDKVEDETGGMDELFRRLFFLRSHFRVGAVQSVFLVLYVIFCALLAAAPLLSGRVRKRLLWPAGGVLAYWTLLTFACAEDRMGNPRLAFPLREDELFPAVISAPEVKVRSGNSENFQVVFVLHDGAEVEAGEHRGNWVEIYLPDDKRGWVPKASLEVLNRK